MPTSNTGENFNDAPRRRSMGHGLHLTARRADGSVFPVEIALAPADVAGEHVVIATLRDVSANRLADAELEAARQRVILAEDHERIARDLHDTVIQRLFAAGLSLQSVLPIVPEAAKVKIERILDDQDDAIHELRTAIFGLASKRSAGRTIRVLVNDLVDDSSRVLGFRPSLHFNGVLDTIDPDVADEVAAVVREALSNVARHSRARRVEVLAQPRRRRTHPGGQRRRCGHPLRVTAWAAACSTCRTGAARMGGTCTVTSGERHGTIVRWQVPVGD